MAKLSPPDAFNFSLPDSWPAWKQRFSRYRLASGLSASSTDPVNISTLLYCMGPEAESVFAQLKFDSDGDDAKYDKVMEKLDAYFTPALNVFHQRTIFEQCVHLPGESVEEFVRKLHDAAKYCDFGDQKDTRIRDRLVAHLLDRQVAQELQKEDPKKLTLTAAVLKARQAEKVATEVAAQTGRRASMPPRHAHDVHVSSAATVSNQSKHAGKRGQSKPASSQRKHQSHQSPPASSSSSAHSQMQNAPKKPCPWCGRATSHWNNRSECPAYGGTCSQCSKSGHFAKVCRSAPAAATSGSREARCVDTNGGAQSSPSTETPFLGNVHKAQRPSSPWTVELNICDTPLTFKIDTGADVSCITYATYRNLRTLPSLTAATGQLLGPSGETLQVRGQFTANGTYRSRVISFPVTVLDGTGTTNLLSRHDSTQLGLIQRLQSVQDTAPLGCMIGPPVDITLTDDAAPYHCGVARRVALPLQEKVKDELDRMERLGVIVRETNPTDWCAPIVPVPKPDGRVRVCVDLKRLNAAVKREYFPLPTVDTTLAKLSGSTVFSTLDTNSGFWQVPLTENASKLTTFITPVGRFRFLRMPFGISSAPEIFQRRLQSILDSVPGTAVFMDDIIVHGATIADHDASLAATRKILTSSGITLNTRKCNYRQKAVKYLGHIITGEGIKPDPAKIQALLDLPDPTNVSEARRAMGMFTYLARFLPDLSNISEPIRSLFKADAAWSWDAPQRTAFQKLKDLAAAAPCLAHYDPARPCIVSADASSYGIGGVLLQQHGDIWKPVAYSSRSLTTTEQGYAQIEKECLAAVWCCERFDQYLYGGQPFTLQTDHKPLVPLINTRDLDKVPIRCQRLLMRFLRYNIRAVHVPGKDMLVADTLSRAPSPSVNTSADLTADIDCAISAAVQDLASPSMRDRIAEATASDPTLAKVIRFVQHGWPQTISTDVGPYYQERNQLSHVNGILCHGLRFVIPLSMQSEILGKLHTGHQGINKTLARARQSAWWPGISAAVTQHVTDCHGCIKQRHQPPEPLLPTAFPNRPWQRIATDLCDVNGTSYLITVDYYSRYLDIHRLHSLSAQAVIRHLKTLFAVHGYPEILVSDNGPQFSADSFANFLSSCDTEHRTSSPLYPQSNGEAERAVKTAKQLISKSSDLDEALLAYRTTPLANGYSPAQLLFGRRLRTNLPCSPEMLQPLLPDISKVRDYEQHHKANQQACYDQRHATKTLDSLPNGARVWISDMQKEGTVLEQISERSYLVATSTGTLRRNRHSLKYLPPTTSPDRHSAPAAQSKPTPEPHRTVTVALRNRAHIHPKERLITVM